MLRCAWHAKVFAKVWGKSEIARFHRESCTSYRFTACGSATTIAAPTADYSNEEMHAVLDVNIPSYASEMVTTDRRLDRFDGDINQ